MNAKFLFIIPFYFKWAKQCDLVADEAACLSISFNESTKLILSFAPLQSTVKKMKSLRLKKISSVCILNYS
ncbi:hypothetical protein DDI74_06710 [Chryseobacterium gleum]|nr:hypothetical protein DDI74_06710 [Chryseobacterium gleum]